MAQLPPYRVLWSENAKAALRHHSQRAQTAIALHAWLKSARVLTERLSQKPLEVGEIRWQKGNVSGFHVIQDNLSANFTVDTLRFLVLVSDCHKLFASAN